jgi:hypothetical protein
MKVSGSGMRRSVLVVAMVGALTVGAGLAVRAATLERAGADTGSGQRRR